MSYSIIALCIKSHVEKMKGFTTGNKEIKGEDIWL